jgi:fatty-acyl-CoA synthase
MDYITETLGQVLERQVTNNPDKQFMVFPDRNLSFTYAEFDRRVMYNTRELLLLGSHSTNDELARLKASLYCREVINMQYTSGTTGLPKGVMLTHHNILNNGFHIGEREVVCSGWTPIR